MDKQITVGPFTYAMVDLPDDRWAWAIVTDYLDSQDYKDVIVAFLAGFDPEPEAVRCMLQAFYENL